MYHIHTTTKKYLLRHLILSGLVSLAATLQAATSGDPSDAQKCDSYILQTYSDQVPPTQAQVMPTALANSVNTTPIYTPAYAHLLQPTAVVAYDPTTQCYYTYLVPSYLLLPSNEAPQKVHHYHYHTPLPWEGPPQPNLVLAQCPLPNTAPTSAMAPSYNHPFRQQPPLAITHIDAQPFPPIQTYTPPIQVDQTPSQGQYNREIVPVTSSVTSTKNTHKLATPAAYPHHKPAAQPTQPAPPQNQLLIPANGNCLYTTIIMGYLLPVRQAAAQLTARIDQLFGWQPADDLKKLRQILQNPTPYFTYLQSNTFGKLVTAFMARMQIKKGTWGGPHEIRTIATKLKVNIQAHYPDPSNPTTLVQSLLTKSAEAVTDITLHIIRDKVHPAEVLTKTEKTSATNNPHYQHYRLKYILPPSIPGPILSSTAPPISHKRRSPQKSATQPYLVAWFKAAQTGNSKLLEKLYKSYNIDVDSNTKDDYTALLLSTQERHLNCIKYLCQQGAYIHYKNKQHDTALLLSARNGYIYCLKYLVRQGADIHHKNKQHNTALLLSVKRGHVACVKHLVQQGAHIEDKNNNGDTALLFSLQNGRQGCFNHLVQQGANIHASNKWNNTPLLLSAQKGHLECVKYLLQQGADIHHENKNSNTPLLLGAERGHLKCVKYLLQQDADIIHHENRNGNTALLLSTYNGHLDCVKYLVEQGAHLNHKNKVGYTALLSSAYNGHFDCLKYFVEQGAHIDQKNSSGHTALILGAKNGYIDIVAYLVQQGANINANNRRKNTALTLSAQNGHLGCVKYLVEHGAHLHDTNKLDNTALILSAHNGHLACVKHLVEKGAYIHHKNENGDTALLLSAWNGHLDCLKYLHQQRANIHIKNKWKNTPLLLSLRKGHLDCIKYLVAQGADVNAKGKKESALLLTSAQQGHFDCLKFLLKQGADINTKDNDGNTALLWSAYQGDLDCVKLLVEHGAYINASDQWGNTAILLSAQEGHVDIVQYLAQQGA